MAGILGIHNFNGDRTDLNEICLPLKEAIHHRGEIWKQGSIQNQTFIQAGRYHYQEENFYENDHFIIALDGRVYNTEALQESLHYSEENTLPLLLKAFEFWGSSFPAFLNGPFVIVIFDKRKKQLLLSRDRVGVKPLYFVSLKKKFAFASEQKALLKLPYLSTSLDKGAAFDFFIHGQAEHKNQSLFQYVNELAPGHTKIVSQNSIEEVCYFEMQKVNHFTTEMDAVQDIQGILRRSVHERSQRDKQPASFLSGGLDSAVLASILNDQYSTPLNVYTAKFEEQVHDESSYAKTMADAFGFNQTFVSPNAEEFLENIETLMYTIDLPNYSGGTFLQYELFKRAAENEEEQIFDGTGADALFCGHDYYFSALMVDYLKKGDFVNFRKQWKANPYKALFKRHLLKYALFPKLNKHIKNQISKKYFPEVKYFNPDFLNLHMDRHNEHSQDLLSRGLNEMLVEEYYNGEVKNLLRFVDRCASKFGVEAISPFADDPKLSDFVFGLPASMKLQNGQTKFLLRSAYREQLPKEIIDRKDKFGLRVPNNEWMAHIAEEVKPLFKNELNGIIDSKKFLEDYEQIFKTPSPTENYRWFKFLSFAIWLKVFNVN